MLGLRMLKVIVGLLICLVTSDRCVALELNQLLGRRNLLNIGTFLAVTAFRIPANAEKLSNGKDVKMYVHEHIENADVIMFAKSYCPYCQRSRTLLKELHDESNGWSLDIVNLDRLGEDGPLIQMELLEQTGQRTVPNIFIGGKHIGGSSDLHQLHEDGKLDQMLAEMVENQMNAAESL